MSTQSLPTISLRTGHHLPAAQLLLWVVNYLIHMVLWPIRSAIFGVGSRRLPALREAPAQLMPRSLAAVPPRTAMRSSSLKPGIGRPFPRTRALQPEEEPPLQTRCRCGGTVTYRTTTSRRILRWANHLNAARHWGARWPWEQTEWLGSPTGWRRIERGRRRRTGDPRVPPPQRRHNPFPGRRSENSPLIQQASSAGDPKSSLVRVCANRWHGGRREVLPRDEKGNSGYRRNGLPTLRAQRRAGREAPGHRPLRTNPGRPPPGW